MAMNGNTCLEVTSSAEFISSAIFLLNKYVKDKTNILNSIKLTSDNSQQKAETEALIRQFDLAICRFESSIKPLDRKIDASIHSLSHKQKFVHDKKFPHPLPLNNSRQCSLVAGTSTAGSNEKAITQLNDGPNLMWPAEQTLPTSCPFCKSNFTTPSLLSEHINEKHPKHNEVYENISSLTPEFMLATEKTISGNRQCFYCVATFRSNAPLFRHIQEAHVAYFDVFVNISLLRGDAMQCLKSTAGNRATPGTLHPLQRSITRLPVKPVSNSSNQVLTKTAVAVSIESRVDASQTVPKKTTISAIPSSQNARKSIRTSTITRFSPIAAISSNQPAGNSISVQGAPETVASSTCAPVSSEPVHSARKRRIISGNMPAPASKKAAALAHASGCRIFACSLCGKQFASLTALSIHNSHYCTMRPAEVIKATKGSLPSLPNGAVTQSQAISSSRESPTDDVNCLSSDDESANNFNEVPEDVKRKLIKTVRDAEVILNTIHQEDLVSCMHSINFRKLQNLELV